MTIITKFDLTAKQADGLELKRFLNEILLNTRSIEGDFTKLGPLVS